MEKFARLTSNDLGNNNEVLINEEERLLSSYGVVTKDEMYKITMHLAERLNMLENLIDENKLFISKVAIGDTLYQPAVMHGVKSMTTLEVRSIDILSFDCMFLNCNLISGPNVNGFVHNIDNVGKTLFLNYSDAKSYLDSLGV